MWLEFHSLFFTIIPELYFEIFGFVRISGNIQYVKKAKGKLRWYYPYYEIVIAWM